MKNKNFLFTLSILLVIAVGWLLWMLLITENGSQSTTTIEEEPTVTSFEECVEAGYAVQESYPRRCSTPDGQTFTEDIPEDDAAEEEPEAGSQDDTFRSEKGVEIVLAINEGQKLSSPFTLRGEVPGNWSFEADFPIELVDSEGNTLVRTPATLEGDWMTEELVPFTVELTFPEQPSGANGTLILHKDNPSDLPENDDRLEVPVTF